MAFQPGITEQLSAALKGTSLRSKAIANNIANIHTPGYKRQVVEFEKLLASAIEANGSLRKGEFHPEITQPENTPLGEFGNDVVMETEIGDLIKNSTMHKVYIKLLSKTYQQMEMAMSIK
jgi:flagellar basal-body rod protein FlgB